MATEFKLPELGENIESGDLVRLMIKPGASIAEGEPVMELETDKAVVEVPSSVAGTIGEIRVREGDKLRVGQVIFTVENGSGTGTTPASKTEKLAAQPGSVAATPVPTAQFPQLQLPQPQRSQPPHLHLNRSSERSRRLRTRPASSSCRSWEKTSTPAICCA